MRTERLQEHFKELLKENRARFYPIKRKVPDSDAEERAIRSFPIRNLNTYTVAMHEMGHLVKRHYRYDITPAKEVLRQELEAWDWAHETAITKLDPKAEELALRSYAYYYQPHGNHAIWKRAGVKRGTPVVMESRVIILDARGEEFRLREFDKDYFWKEWMPRHKSEALL